MKREPFYVHCGKCSHEWAPGLMPMPVDTMSVICKRPCPVCGSKKIILGLVPRPTDEGDVMAWLSNGDTGTSSKTIFSVLTGHPIEHTGTPSDPSDFGRCYRLLKVMPTWRARLPEVAEQFPEWRGLVGAWDELTALYEEELPTGRAPKLYDRMKELLA